jgi:hypothetical protein
MDVQCNCINGMWSAGGLVRKPVEDIRVVSQLQRATATETAMHYR